MGFRDVINQRHAKEFLRNSIISGRVANGYLFHGPRGVGKGTLALAFAQGLNCERGDPEACGRCASCQRIARFSHPDVTFIFPTSSRDEFEEISSTLKRRSEEPLFFHTFPGSASIKIRTIQNLRMDLALGVREGKRRVIILAYAERMTLEASNCLLRILEEPTESVTFVLTVPSRHLLLPTIVSRCQAVWFVPLAVEEMEGILVKRGIASPEDASTVARLSGGSLTAALEFAEQDVVKYRKESIEYLNKIDSEKPAEILKAAEKLAAASDRNQVRIFVHLALLWLRDLLLVKCGAAEADIANRDMIDAIREEASTVELTELRRRIDILEEITYSMEQHVDLSLLLCSSFLRLAGIVRDVQQPLGTQRQIDR